MDAGESEGVGKERQRPQPRLLRHTPAPGAVRRSVERTREPTAVLMEKEAEENGGGETVAAQSTTTVDDDEWELALAVAAAEEVEAAAGKWHRTPRSSPHKSVRPSPSPQRSSPRVQRPTSVALRSSPRVRGREATHSPTSAVEVCDSSDDECGALQEMGNVGDSEHDDPRSPLLYLSPEESGTEATDLSPEPWPSPFSARARRSRKAGML